MESSAIKNARLKRGNGVVEDREIWAYFFISLVKNKKTKVAQPSV